MAGTPAHVPDCPYCQRPSELVDGSIIYPNHGDKFAAKNFFRCLPCGAWVGCHQGTFNPMGTLANAELRGVRNAAHRVFDPLWERKMRRDRCSKKVAREAAYHWLAKELSVDRADCHIGLMDIATCDRVIDICSNIGKR